MYPEIQMGCCDGCGLCVEVCPSEVYTLDENAAKVAFPEECIECGVCENECPTACITLVDG